MFFFFFSSRRRHTRYWRDWSSDVCSSDLAATATASAGRRWWREDALRRGFGVGRSERMAVALAEDLAFHAAVAQLEPAGTRVKVSYRPHPAVPHDSLEGNPGGLVPANGSGAGDLHERLDERLFLPRARCAHGPDVP